MGKDLVLTPKELKKVKEFVERMREVQSDTGHGKVIAVISFKKIRTIEITKTVKVEDDDNG